MAKVPAAQPVTYPSMMQGLSASHGRMSNTAVGNRNKNRRAFRAVVDASCPLWREAALCLQKAPVTFLESSKLARPAATSRCRSRADRFDAFISAPRRRTCWFPCPPALPQSSEFSNSSGFLPSSVGTTVVPAPKLGWPQTQRKHARSDVGDKWPIGHRKLLSWTKPVRSWTKRAN